MDSFIHYIEHLGDLLTHWESWMLVLTMFVLEGILSLDNSTVLASQVRGLNENDQRKAIRIGMVLAFVFRGAMLGVTQELATLEWLKVFCGIYLIWLVFDFFAEGTKNGEVKKNLFKVVTSILFILFVEGETIFSVGDAKINVVSIFKAVVGLLCAWLLIKAHQHLKMPAEKTNESETPTTQKEKKTAKSLTFGVILTIGITDLAFSIDNVFVCIGITKEFVLIILSVILGMLAMSYIAKLINSYIKKYPFLDKSAHIIIALVGLKMVLGYVAYKYPESAFAHGFHSHITEIANSILSILIFVVPIGISKWQMRNRDKTNQRRLLRVLADGKINLYDVGYIRTIMLVNNTLDEKDLELLFDLYYSTREQDNDPEWRELYKDVLLAYVLNDPKQPGVLSTDEAEFIKENIMIDGIDEIEQYALRSILEKSDVILDLEFRAWAEEMIKMEPNKIVTRTDSKLNNA